jgi:hypothetical protein
MPPNFIASHIGIGNNYLAMGKRDRARTALAKIASVAGTTGSGDATRATKFAAKPRTSTV